MIKLLLINKIYDGYHYDCDLILVKFSNTLFNFVNSRIKKLCYEEIAGHFACRFCLNTVFPD